MAVRALAAACVAASLLLPFHARAQAVDPEARALAQQIMDMTFTGEFVDTVVAQSWPQMEQVIGNAAPQLRQDQIAELRKDFSDLMREQIKGMLADMPELYVKHFTAAELKDMMAFYQTETGKKLIAVTPALSGDLMQKSGERMPAMMETLMQRFREMLAKKGVRI